MELNQLAMPKAGDKIATIKTTLGDIKVKLFGDVAPKTVENFCKHAMEGYYDGVIFHRVIKDFMIQTGDPTGTGRGGESIYGGSFKDEFDPLYRNLNGALCMANAGPNTNGSQFFIVQNSTIDADILRQMREAGEEKGYPESVVNAYESRGGCFWLDFKHTVFGQVYEGMDVVNAIANVKTGNADKPLEEISMKEIIVEEYK